MIMRGKFPRKSRRSPRLQACGNCGAPKTSHATCACQAGKVVLADGLEPMRPWPLAERAEAWEH